MKSVIALIISTCLTSVGFARFGGEYTFAQLFEMSDLVVIIEHKSTEMTEDKAEAQNGGEGLLTTAEIIGTLKGSCQSTTIRIRHFRYDRVPKSEPGDGVRFPGFDEAGRFVETSTKIETSTTPWKTGAFFRPPYQYIAFLKRQEEELYVPTLPQERSADSFRMLVGSNTIMNFSVPQRPAQAADPMASRYLFRENYRKAEGANPAEQAGADQPATRPADKAAAKGQPSPPTPKVVPR